MISSDIFKGVPYGVAVAAGAEENWALFRHSCALFLKDPLQDFLWYATFILLGQEYGDYDVHAIEQLEEMEDTLRRYGVY